MDFEVLLKKVGDFGKYQKLLLYLFFLPTATLAPLLCTTTLFMVSSPKYRCFHHSVNNQSEHRPNLFKDEQDACLFKNSSYETRASNNSNATNNICEFWIYDTTNYEENAVTFFNLICDHDYYPSLILSSVSLGSIIGAPIFGYLSDKIGRKKTFFLAIAVILLSTISPILIKDLWAFIFFRFVNVIEVVATERRTTITTLSSVCVAIGLSVLPLIVFLTKSWVKLNIVTAVTASILLLYWRFVPESPRWLVTKKRYQEARTVLKYIAKVNKKDIPLNFMQNVNNIETTEEQNVQRRIIEFVTNTKLRTVCFFITISCIANEVAYTGLQLNIINFHGNEFVNFFLFSIVEIPSFVIGWFLMESSLGRRWSACICLFCSAVSLAVCASFPVDSDLATTTFATIGKMFVTTSYMILSLQAAELYPTDIRNQGLSISSTGVSVVTVFLPFLIYIGNQGKWIPLVIMSSFCIVASVVSSFLPETRNEKLIENVDQIKFYGKEREYWSLASAK
ncbi:Organic cation transporter 1-like protein [Leptotrombidium deliense]|uniref:Organic cation transporter 1-like protein n=1 Tax=Leptotrombidium deliense TaxID=299467 RepID=A0A443SFJ9_9ACAR|nr:Organic cation transporter 1-like protein [Leptotrombidium deliense]